MYINFLEHMLIFISLHFHLTKILALVDCPCLFLTPSAGKFFAIWEFQFSAWSMFAPWIRVKSMNVMNIMSFLWLSTLLSRCEYPGAAKFLPTYFSVILWQMLGFMFQHNGAINGAMMGSEILYLSLWPCMALPAGSSFIEWPWNNYNGWWALESGVKSISTLW